MQVQFTGRKGDECPRNERRLRDKESTFSLLSSEAEQQFLKDHVGGNMLHSLS